MSLPEDYKFRYRLLASADIIGSTAFKSGQASQRKMWAHVFHDFFDEFPRELARQFDLVDAGVLKGAKPRKCMDIWKLVGDEILFVTELGRHEEAACHILALMEALNEYSTKLSRKHQGLALKGTVWGAGFPVMNVQVATRSSREGHIASDYLGPSVDLGFRLAALADRRRIPVSADIAWFLIRACQESTPLRKLVHMYADPPQLLKGIDAGGPYPILWLDRRRGEETPEDKLLHRIRGSVDWTVLREYVEAHQESGAIGLMRPFIMSDPSPEFNRVPAEFVRWRDRLYEQDPDRLSEAQGEDPGASVRVVEPPLPRALMKKKRVGGTKRGGKGSSKRA